MLLRRRQTDWTKFNAGQVARRTCASESCWKEQLQPSNSPWASYVVQLVFVEKDGKVRFFVHYRSLNDFTIKNSYLFLQIGECFIFTSQVSGLLSFTSGASLLVKMGMLKLFSCSYMGLNSRFWKIASRWTRHKLKHKPQIVQTHSNAFWLRQCAIYALVCDGKRPYKQEAARMSGK